MNRVLMIAYHFPPVAGSSGVQRTLKYSQYLPEFGWQAAVLSVHPRAYERTDGGQLEEVPATVPVVRAFALDAARHLRILGRYPGILAIPDRWVSWLLGGIPAGLGLIRQWRPNLLWSTYPVATAHLLGLVLSRLSGIPWVADFRDSMTEPGYPAASAQWRAFRSIESRTVMRAERCVFTTPGAARMYRERYPQVAASRMTIIENAFDEENFRAVEEQGRLDRLERDAPLTLLHSGVLYPSERDPSALFEALSHLKATKRLSAGDVQVVLRATGHDDLHAEAIRRFDIEDLVRLAPPLPYSYALREMLQADALLLLQAASCNHQIPAKLYEYLRARRPVLALTDPAGDTAGALRAAGITSIVRLDDARSIESALPAFLARVRSASADVASDAVVQANTRRARTRSLARLFDDVLAVAGDSSR